MNTIGERICNLRKLFRLTQCQLAEKIHLSDKVISKWENGESKPNLDDANALSQFFGVTLDYLISGKKTRQDETVLSRKPSEEDLISDAKADFLKRCNAIIRNNNLYKYKDKIFPEKRCDYYLKKDIPKEYATVGIFHPLVSKKTEKYEIGINLKELLAIDDYDLFEKIVSLNIPFCRKNEIVDFYGQKLLTHKDVEGTTDTRFYAFLSNQEPLIKQTLERNGYSFEEHMKNENGFYSEQYKKILSEALAALDRKRPNYWETVKLLIENGAFVKKLDDITTDNDGYQKKIYIDDINFTEMLYDFACLKSQNKN